MSNLRLSSALVVAVAAFVVQPLTAGVIVGFDPALAISHERHDIYSTGFASAPVRNPNATFLGAGFDLTPIGFVSNNGVQGVTMISPQHFVMAAHFPPTSNTVNFVNAANQLRSYTIQSTVILTTTVFNGAMVNRSSDVLIGRLNAPIPAGDGIGFLPIAYDPNVDLRNGPIPGVTGYNPLPVLAQGFNGGYTNPANGFTSPHLGANVVDRGPNITLEGASIGTVTIGYDFNGLLNGEFHAIGGDSGSPSLAVINGRLAALGLHYDLLPDNSSIDSLLAYYVDQMNAFMAPDSMQVTLSAIPEPSSLALVAAGVCLVRWRRRRSR